MTLQGRGQGALPFRDAGHGYDLFGLNPVAVRRALRAIRFFYKSYFRVSSHGIDNVPATGPAILAANHSGMLPIDAVMLYADVVERARPARIPRPLLDFFVPLLPFFGTFFSRMGAVSGTRGNMRRLLESDELLMVFPEGTPGISKSFRKRYQLQGWRVGHAELAIRYRAPVVPVAIIGAEEQWPVLARIERFKLFGAPFVPIPATPFPLPVHYHIYYGEPLALHEGHASEACDDPEVVARAAERVRAAVEELIERGLSERAGVFR